jgi:hypothetical protein
VNPVIGKRAGGPRGIAGEEPMPNGRGIANAQRPNPVVRNVNPRVIGGRNGLRGPAGEPIEGAGPRTGVPGSRVGRMGPNMKAGIAGKDTRGVFGTRQSKMAQAAEGEMPGGARAGVRAPSMRANNTGLSRGVIRGAKAGGMSAEEGMNSRAGGAGRYGAAAGAKGRRKQDEREATLSSDGPLDDVFAIDQTVVPGVIRGHDVDDTEHTAGPAAFGERPGKNVKKDKKKDFDAEWDDW